MWTPESDLGMPGNSLIFIPSVGPGYVDIKARPWNARKFFDIYTKCFTKIFGDNQSQTFLGSINCLSPIDNLF